MSITKMSITGVTDIDQKICLCVHIDDIINVMLINDYTKKLITDNIEEYIRDICQDFYDNLGKFEHIKEFDERYCYDRDDAQNYYGNFQNYYHDLENFEYGDILIFLTQLLEINETILAKKVIESFNLIDKSDKYLSMYELLSSNEPSELNSKIIESFFSILPDNYNESELIKIDNHNKTIYNMLEHVHNKGFSKIVDYFLKFCTQGALIFNEMNGDYAIKFKCLVSQIKISIEMNNLMTLDHKYYNKTIMLDIKDKVKLL